MIRHGFAGLLLVGVVGCGSSGQHEKPMTTAPAAARTEAMKPAEGATGTRALSVAEFEAARKEHPEYVLLDVRTPAEYSAGHLEGAKLVDFRSPDFDRQVAALDHGKTYLVYCRTGHRSGLACQKLGEKGLKAFNMNGGITAWQQAQMPVTK